LVAGFVLGALGYTLLAWTFRQAAFVWPAVVAVTVAYAVGLTLTPLPERARGLGLLPLLLVALIVADFLRRSLDGADRDALRPLAARLLESWATPLYLLAYGGTLAVVALSWHDAGILAFAWWGVAALFALSTALFRRPLSLYPGIGAALAALVVTVH